MTYLQFLALFLLPPVVLLGWMQRRRLGRATLLALGLIILLALVYTGPWDNHLIAIGVWRYPRARVLGLRIGLVPIEEYLFYVLQVIVTGLLTLATRAQDGDASSGRTRRLKP